MDETKGGLEIGFWAFHSPRIRVRLQRSRVTCGFIKTALPDVWPILGIGAKPRTNWIHADVVGFFDSGLQIS